MNHRPDRQTPPAPGRRRRRPGVALVAVLAVLTVLALLSGIFSVNMGMEYLAGKFSVARNQADVLADSGLEHAKSMLRIDSQISPAWDDLTEPWNAHFVPRRNADYVDVDGLPEDGTSGRKEDARWFYVFAEDGSVVGRYAVRVEDEAAKVNVNVAAAVSDTMQNQGVGAFETMLTDGGQSGLPISREFGVNVLRYRYGRDRSPGQRDVDDNLTASSYAGDEMDNDADSLVDEPGEGIDEQEEYDSVSPRWDDRSIGSMRELVDAGARTQLSTRAQRYLRRYGTTHSRVRDMYWDERDQTWRRQVNLNVGSRDQVQSLLRRANEESRFEPNSRNMRVMVANVLDYRDHNHVLTTLGSDYGVEAVCFNEIMANNGSYSLEADGKAPNEEGYTRYTYGHRFGQWYNLSSDKYNNFRYGWRIKSVRGRNTSASVQTNGVVVTVPDTAEVELEDDIGRIPSGGDRALYDEFKDFLQENGGWYPEMFRNAWLVLYRNSNDPEAYYPIVGNDRDTLTVGIDETGGYPVGLLTNADVYVRIDTLWRPQAACVALFPEQTDCWIFPTQTDPSIPVPRDLYYYVFIGEQNFGGNLGVEDYPFRNRVEGPWRGYCDVMDVDGNATAYRETRMDELRREDLRGSTLQIPFGKDKVDLLRFAYKDGEPIRARNGRIPVLLTTAKRCGYVGGMRRTSTSQAFANKNCFDVVYVMRPDYLELINISDRPISLRNWEVVINTGSYADQVGLIDNAVLYSARRGGRYDDPNPTIPAKGYFYLTNRRDIFDYEHGASREGRWGSASDEAFPCFELPDYLWGVRYRIRGVNGNRLSLSGANWRQDQMKFEMAEIHTSRRVSDRNFATGVGIRKSVFESGRDWIEAQPNIDWAFDGVQAGDDVLLLGIPREGGFLSMTLRNEYGQIAARTITYGSVDADELNYSTEKVDPTHYNWIKNAQPTMGGSERRAVNTTMRRGGIIPPHIKDNRFASVGEIQKVRRAEDWENIGMERMGQPNTDVLKAISKYFSVSGVRLDPEEEGAHIGGWSPAYGTVAFGGTDQLTADSVDWEPAIWGGQTLRMTSGALKGEQFAIARNSQNSVWVTGYSVPGYQQLRVRPGDTFTVGPGYATGMFYTRQNGDEGEWEWTNKGLMPGSYGLYIYGLNDSIDTTEFLEENHNAQLEIAVFNYTTREYDRLPLPDERISGRGGGDPYRFVRGIRRHRYDKSDGFYAGQVHAEHISPESGIKLRLTAAGLAGANGSGNAWFDYAYLTPGTVEGKINLNTASERVLTALPGVTTDLARNIAGGLDKSNRRRLKPYRNSSDVLDVRGVSADLFTRIANLVTTRSDQYRVQVLAQAVTDTDRDGVFEPETGEPINAQSRRDVVIDRSELTDDSPDSGIFRVYMMH